MQFYEIRPLRATSNLACSANEAQERRRGNGTGRANGFARVGE